MDATMIASKICEPELNAMKVVFSGLSDHERLNLVANKINHYTRIYLKCAKKVYNEWFYIFVKIVLNWWKCNNLRFAYIKFQI